MVSDKVAEGKLKPDQEIIRNFIGRMQLVAQRPMFASGITYQSAVKTGASIRDIWLHRYSILPGATNTYINIATSREWAILGSPRQASRVLDRLNRTYFMDELGIRHEGWEDVMSRMCMDWLSIGRCMISSKILVDNDWEPLEYIDSADVLPQNSRNSRKNIIWNYNHLYSGLRDIPQENMFFLDCFRIGKTGVPVGIIPYLIPVAHLDWLLREHDSMQLDGRKIRDIFFVDEGMDENVEKAILASMAMSSGEDPSKWHIPLVAVDRTDASVPLSNYFARFGLSEIPRDFDREDFLSRYAKEISSTLGLPLGQFWHDPRGTNRSLEQVTQERATLKGPSYFVRSVERLINNSPFMGRTPKTRCIIQFEEETDTSALQNQAAAFKAYLEGLEKLQTIMMNAPESEKQQFDADRWIGFIEKKMLIPANVTLADVVAREEMSLQRSADETMQKGWVRMNQYGLITERRPDFLISRPPIRQVTEEEGIEGYFLLSFANCPELINVVNEKIKPFFSGIEWASPETYHCTLVHGTFSWMGLSQIQQAMKTFKVDHMGSVDIDQLGIFTNEENQQTLHLKVLPSTYGSVQSNLFTLASLCAESISEFSQPELWKPHITLGRGMDIAIPEVQHLFDYFSAQPTGIIFNIEIADHRYEVLSALGGQYRSIDLETIKHDSLQQVSAPSLPL